ncbi:hypothetical protein CPB84DRAFT_1818218 [Gymnopilus junonius]|uniref:C2H2-type domain-containing protein n=1 Tax=Gymnopilus junonius TaxID=109634 RepID=A0A9P5N771_GYMJU|nr:hypothetical protein CPB84DRAFT_1818218 [Gymnopilus junonius]
MPKQVDGKYSCPRCGKPFAAESFVLNHMNQPQSKCRFLYENVLHFQHSNTQERGVPSIAKPSEALHPPSFPSGEMNAFSGDIDMDMDDQEPCGESIFDPLQSNAPNFFCEEFPDAARVHAKGKTFMDCFDMDEHAKKRSENLYYPFAMWSEWQLVSFLLRSSLSMSAIDEFLKLDLVAEILPSGPHWLYRSMPTAFPTKNSIHLYYRNPLECLESLLNSPLLKDHIKFSPVRLFETAEKLMRVYTKWLSGDAAWFMQARSSNLCPSFSKLPPGATLLGTILSSDKTNISNMTGGHVAHPLLISLANLDMEFRNKASNHAFLLLGLLPPLKIAAQVGVLMADPVGAMRCLAAVEANTDPNHLEDYVKEAMKYCLNGVHHPFWHDWALSDPSIFLTSEPLHHWHKQFWDHDAKWCIFAVGASEIDFCFSILHPHTGYRHFHEGISSLKQVTGLPSSFLIAIRSLLDFCYLTQAKNGPINNWEIPKLEFLQSVVSNIHYNGIAIQWSADTTEFAHIPLVKDPAHSGNNQSYEPQICCSLDRNNKLELFDLATSIHAAGLSFESPDDMLCLGMMADVHENAADVQELDENAEQDLKIHTTADLLSYIMSVGALPGSSFSMHGLTNYFYHAKLLQRGALSGSSYSPHHTYQSSTNMVFHLSRDPHIHRMPVDDIANQFDLPDLCPAIADYVAHLRNDTSDGFIRSVGGRRFAKPGCYLPVTHLEVWKKMRFQTTAYHYPHDILPPKQSTWPKSGLKGHVVCDLRLIFRLISARSSIDLLNITDCFLCYPDPGNPTLHGPHPHPSSGLHALKHGKCTSGDIIGDVIPLDQLRALADVAPHLGAKADWCFTKENSLHYSTEFWLNKYFDKEFFYALN